MSDIILQMKNITKAFPGVKALSDVNLTVNKGEIHGLVGENGAGKSTLMNVLSGVYPFGAYKGDIIYEDEICRFGGLKDSEKRGIVIIHQELALIPTLSIGENMFLGNECRSRKGIIDWNATYKKAGEYLDLVGLSENPHTLVKDIGTGKQQLVEIAKAMAKNVKLLILDEPTSSLNENDAQHLLDLLLELKNNKGITSVIISHKLNEIAYVTDRITVIRDGQVIETMDNHAKEVDEGRIVTGMVGREMKERFPAREHCIGDVAFEVRNWSAYHPVYSEKKVVDNVSLYVNKGEIVGVAGLVGAGRTELCQSIFGHVYGCKISGELYKNGESIIIESVADAVNKGVAYVTEDRKVDGLILTNSILRNITLSRLDRVSRRGIINVPEEKLIATKYAKELNVKAPTVYQMAGNLSGGNQQKVLLAKWIYAQPDILMLDEPTRGIDVGSKHEIYCIMNQLVAEGKSVLMISSEMPELLGMCDRIYAMYEGRIVGEFTREEASQELIMSTILKASKGEAVVP